MEIEPQEVADTHPVYTDNLNRLTSADENAQLFSIIRTEGQRVERFDVITHLEDHSTTPFFEYKKMSGCQEYVFFGLSSKIILVA